MKEILTSVRRTPYQSLASFFILFFTLFLSLFFFNLTTFFYGFLNFVETQPQVIIYFQTETKEDVISQVKHSIEQTGTTTAIKYVSKQDAFKIYKNLEKNNPLLLEMVSADILPASLEVNAKKPEYLSQIAEFAKKQTSVDEVVFQKDIVEKLVTFTTIVRRVSFMVYSILIFITFIVLMTTTAFKIALKKDEIELQRLLGASRFYARKPFLAEGMLFGFVSATLAFGVYYIIFVSLRPFLNSYLAGIPNLPFFGLDQYNLFVWPPSLFFILLSYGLTVLFGMLIGLFGNYLSTSKYIK